jgi:hypothetical protein
MHPEKGRTQSHRNFNQVTELMTSHPVMLTAIRIQQHTTILINHFRSDQVYNGRTVYSTVLYNGRTVPVQYCTTDGPYTVQYCFCTNATGKILNFSAIVNKQPGARENSEFADNTKTGCFKRTCRANLSEWGGAEIWVCTCLGSKGGNGRGSDERVQPNTSRSNFAAGHIMIVPKETLGRTQ